MKKKNTIIISVIVILIVCITGSTLLLKSDETKKEEENTKVDNEQNTNENNKDNDNNESENDENVDVEDFEYEYVTMHDLIYNEIKEDVNLVNDPNLVLKKINKKEKFEYNYVYENKYIRYTSSDFNGIYDFSGNLILDLSPYKDIEIENGYIKLDGILYDKTGKFIFNGSYFDDFEYSEKCMIIVEKNNKKGLVDKTGNKITNIEYKDIEIDKETCIAKTYKNEKYGLINKDGAVIETEKYSDIDVKSENCIIIAERNKNDRNLYYTYNVSLKQKYGPYIEIIYINDETIIAEHYDTDLDNFDGLIKTSLVDYYIINILDNTKTKREDLEKYNFFSSTLFEDVLKGYTFVSQGNLGYGTFVDGVLDENLKEVIPPQYLDLNVLKNNKDKLLAQKIDGSFEIITYDNKKILTNLKNVGDDTTLYNELIRVEEEIWENKGNYKKKVRSAYNYFDYNGNLVYNSDDSSDLYFIGDKRYIINDYGVDKCIYLDMSNNTKKELNYEIFCNFDSEYTEGYLLGVDGEKAILYNNKLKKLYEADSVVWKEHYYIAYNDGKYKILNRNVTLLTDLEFETITVDYYDYYGYSYSLLTTKTGEVYYLNSK